MQSDIIRALVSKAGAPQLLDVLSEELSASELQSLLLAVFHSRSRGAQAGQIAARSNEALFVRSSVDARTLHRFDAAAFEAALQFEAIDASPVAPFGASGLLGGIDQNNVLTTIRRAEVLGDPATALALECAIRRKPQIARSAQPVRLCTSQRVVRLQPFDHPGFTPHFRLFCLASAGRDTGSDSFEIQHLREHIECYLRLFRALNRDGFTLNMPLVEISDTEIVEKVLATSVGAREQVRRSVRAHRPGGSRLVLEAHGLALPSDITDPVVELAALAAVHSLDRELHRLNRVKCEVVDALRERYPEAHFRFNLSRLEGVGYYDGLCLRISPATAAGNRFGMVDGGFLRWTARLLQDRKERFLASGIGTEGVCKLYAIDVSPRPASGV